jgi:hypothetical protein
MTSSRSLPPQVVHVFEADQIWVTSGANQGDGLGLAAESQAGDVYQLDRAAQPLRLLIAAGADSGQRICAGSQVGAEGDRIALLARHVMITPDGDTVDILLIRNDDAQTLYALPLSPIAPRVEYTLIEALEDPGDVRLSDLVCIAFTTGTLITLAGGAQRAIETLAPGDRVLTRDSGPQPVRLVAKATLRALGSFAPVVISAGTLGNESDLVVAPHHRVFLYRRGEKRLGDTAEILVQAKHLVDGEHVWRREGGYVDYYALVFDHHEIVYAEGVPVESLQVSEATLSLMPEELTAEIRARLPNLDHTPHFGTEAGRDMLDRVGRMALFKKKE